MMSKFHLAEINIAKMKTHLEHPSMHGFVSRLDEINALAESHPGFVWRLQDETGNATEIQVFDDPSLIVNMSVWESIEQLKNYTYKTVHTEVMRLRKQWFHHFEGVYFAMWWIPAGHVPTLQEAKEKLAFLEKNGPTAAAFNFRHSFDPPII